MSVGRPLLRKMNRIVEANGGEEWVFSRIANGEKIADIAVDLGCSRPYFYNWLKQHPHKERRMQMYQEALLLSASAKEEQGEEILDDLAGRIEINAQDVTLAVARSNYRKWQATVRDRATYGDKGRDLAVSINVGSLHLDALRARGPQTARAEVMGTEPVAELMPVEVVDGED